eukprot:5319617-Amphidinium_carterae.1
MFTLLVVCNITPDSTLKSQTGCMRNSPLLCCNFALLRSEDELVLAHLPFWPKAWPTPDHSCGWHHFCAVDEGLGAPSLDLQAAAAAPYDGLSVVVAS